MKKRIFATTAALLCLFTFNGHAGVLTDTVIKAQKPVQASPKAKEKRRMQAVNQRLQQASLSPAASRHLLALLEQQQDRVKTNQAEPAAEAAEYSHLFLDMNIARSDDNGQDYLIIQAKSSTLGGSDLTYLDLYLGDDSGSALTDIASELETSNTATTKVQAKVPLTRLKTEFPDLEMIHADSVLDMMVADGSRVTQLISTRYAIPWQQINARLASADTASGDNYSSQQTKTLQQTELQLSHPGDLNGDDQIKFCFNHNYYDCDYAGGFPPPYKAVEVPFQGKLVLPYEILAIYPSAGTTDLTGIIDSQTNIYVQSAHWGYSLSPVFTTADNQTKPFSDYLSLNVDAKQGTSTIEWSIPRQESRLNNGEYIGYAQQVDWLITLILSGYPTASAKAAQTPVNFQVTLSSEQAGGFSHYAFPKLSPITLEY
ncbi:hypothetical protein SG34_009090 [Thalassomonas viridans]|uniref:Uncharacterized protein n=1 Tax=Thalassomonas viridans TaxID=137584 RepID=A0AAF0CB98_9GAMM|nr:hypothetical protein [Thalassomonas viridans]WDE07020.1 hypothetical protein SG34_009090 [Thalassomonas viridans]